MIDSLQAQLTTHGVPDGQIHAEEFGFAKLGRTGSTAASPRSAPVPLTALVGALSAAVALIAIALLVAGYAT